MKETVIDHPAEDVFYIVRSWYKKICSPIKVTAGCAAAILSKMEYWHNANLDKVKRGECKDVKMRPSLAYIQKELCHSFSVNTIRKALGFLIMEEFILPFETDNGKRNEYEFNVERVNEFANHIKNDTVLPYKYHIKIDTVTISKLTRGYIKIDTVTLSNLIRHIKIYSIDNNSKDNIVKKGEVEIEQPVKTGKKKKTSKGAATVRLPDETVELPFGERFAAKWEEWKAYKKESFRFTYKPKGLASAITRMKNIASSEEEAIKILDNAMGCGYRGFFPLNSKSNDNGISQEKRDIVNTLTNAIGDQYDQFAAALASTG